MALNIPLRVILFVAFCHTATGQDNRPKNIKMLFVPSDVMKTLRRNLTLKDLPAGISAPGSQRWSPVHLPGDKTHSFEIRINPRAAHRLNMNFQHIKIGRGEGLLLELRNVTLTTKGKTMLDRLIEFYKNCGSRKPQRPRRPTPSLKHSLLLPGDIPLLKRIQNALAHFFPKRHDGSVDVYQHKDSNGAVHFLPFEEVRKQVNSLIRRTLVRRDCVKISSHALTQALEAFRRQTAQQNATPTEATVGDGEHEDQNGNNAEGVETNENSDENEETNNINNNNNNINNNNINNNNINNNNINSNNNDNINNNNDNNNNDSNDNNDENENNNENDNSDNNNSENNVNNNNNDNNNRDESYTENEGQVGTENINNIDDINMNNNNIEGDGNINAQYTDRYENTNNDMTSFSRNLDILNSPAHYKGNITSSAALNVPSDSTATKIVTALADLRKEIKVLTSNFKQNQHIPSDGKEDAESTDDNWNNGKKISSSDKEGNDTKDGKFDLNKVIDSGEVKNRLKKMSSDDTDDKSGNKYSSKQRENNDSLSKLRPLNTSAITNASQPTKTAQGKEIRPMMNITKIFSHSVFGNGFYGYKVMQKVGLLNETTNETANKLVNPTIKQFASQNVNQPANQAVSKPNIAYVNHTIGNQVINRQPVNQAVVHEAVNQTDHEAANQAVDHENGDEAVDHETVNQTVDHESVNQAADHESVSQSVDQEPVNQTVDQELVNQAVEQAPVNQASDRQRFNQAAVHQSASQAVAFSPAIQAFTPQHSIDVVKHKPVNQPVNQPVNLSHRVAALKDDKVDVENKKITSPIAHAGAKNAEGQAKIEESKGKGDTEQAVHIKDPEDPAEPSIIFHYKAKKVKEKSSNKDENDKEAGYEDSIKERFRKIRRLRRPRIKEMVLQDDDDNENQGKMYDVPDDVNYDEDGLKARLLRKLRRLRIRHRFTHGRKSPKLRVVVYDDEYDDKEPHDNNWRDTESEEFSQKIHDEDNDPGAEPTMHRSDSVLMDDADSTQETSQQYDQPESRNPASDTDSDIQELSDSLGEDNHLSDKSDRGDDTVPDLEPYLKKNYEDEEDEENEEIKMYNDQDGIDARKLTKIGDSEANGITKPLKDVDTVVTEKTQNLENDENDAGDAPSKIRIHKLPFKIQEDSDGIDTSLLKEPSHDPLGMQQVLTPPGYPSIASSQAMSVSSSPPAATTNPNGLDLSANVVMPPEQSTILAGDNGQLAPMNNAFQMPRPNVPATLTGLVNYQPSVTTQMNSLMPQTPFPQVGSIMPMQPRPAEVATPMTPVMQPGQMRATISGGPKAAPKLTETGVRKTLTPKDPKWKKRIRQRGIFVSKNLRNKSHAAVSKTLTSQSKKLVAKTKI